MTVTRTLRGRQRRRRGLLTLTLLLLSACSASPPGSAPLPAHVVHERLYLAKAPYQRLVVEVDAVCGAEPDDRTLEMLAQSLRQH
ncbi:hypothetical protein ACFL59_15465, partial [Planctomycetota bacterium]